MHITSITVGKPNSSDKYNRYCTSCVDQGTMNSQGSMFTVFSRHGFESYEVDKTSTSKKKTERKSSISITDATNPISGIKKGWFGL